VTEVRLVTPDEFLACANYQALFAEYAAESSTEGLPAPQPDMALYRALHASGCMHTLAAFQGDTLIGFLVMLAHRNPHYGITLAVAESLFVAAAHRAGGAGLRLMREAEDLGARLGAAGIFLSAPAGGKLERMMQASSAYRHSNTVFFRSLQGVGHG